MMVRKILEVFFPRNHLFRLNAHLTFTAALKQIMWLVWICGTCSQNRTKYLSFQVDLYFRKVTVVSVNRSGLKYGERLEWYSRPWAWRRSRAARRRRSWSRTWWRGAARASAGTRPRARPRLARSAPGSAPPASARCGPRSRSTPAPAHRTHTTRYCCTSNLKSF